MYINKTTLEGVSGFNGFSDYYWSSTEFNVNSAWAQDFSGGVQYYGTKSFTGTRNVRAVRAF